MVKHREPEAIKMGQPIGEKHRNVLQTLSTKGRREYLLKNLNKLAPIRQRTKFVNWYDSIDARISDAAQSSKWRDRLQLYVEAGGHDYYAWVLNRKEARGD